jgi:chromosome segregation ATPase
MAKNILIIRMLLIPVLIISLAGCKNNKKQKALAEQLAQARMENVKLKAETVQLKSEISYLNEKLVAANVARDNAQIQMENLIEDSNTTITDIDSLQRENDKLRKLLAEQLKKNNELGKQIETLKNAIREIQARIDPNKTADDSQHPAEETPIAPR